MRLIALDTKRVIRHRTPNGITKIGTIPQPDGTQVLLTNGASRITKMARTDTRTLPRKPKARYFSRGELVSGEVDWILELGFLAIPLDYWLG